jgi:hypothetical protein
MKNKIKEICKKLPFIQAIYRSLINYQLKSKSVNDIFLALNNICESNSKYLLTTTFTERSCNADIATGQWRTLNLQIPLSTFRIQKK